MDWYSLKQAVAFLIIAFIYPYYMWGVPNFVFELKNSRDMNNAIRTLFSKKTYSTPYFVTFRTYTYVIIGIGFLVYVIYEYFCK